MHAPLKLPGPHAGRQDRRGESLRVMDRVGGRHGIVRELDRQRLAILRIGFVQGISRTGDRYADPVASLKNLA